MSYAICRVAKLNTKGSVAASGSHAFRERDTPNAEPSRLKQNEVEGARSVAELSKAVDDRLATVPTIRKNAVLTVEYVLTASPEFFQKATPDDQAKFFAQSKAWLADRHGKENIVSMVIHRDETTPHLSAFVVPIDPKGRLNASHWFDGRQKLTEMQSDFAERVGRPVGLERGLEGSVATHTTVKEFYAAVRRDIDQKPLPVPEVSLLTRAIFDGGEVQHRRDVIAYNQNLPELNLKTAQAKAKLFDQKSKEVEVAQANLEAVKKQAVIVRQIPLETVLEKFECVRSAKDKKNWETPIGRVSIEGAKFFAHDEGKGGGGAIDLVMQLHHVDYKQAVGMLTQKFGVEAVVAERITDVKKEVEQSKTIPIPLPAPVPERWKRVEKYLTEKRKIPFSLVSLLHEAGKVFADNSSNAAFVLTSFGKPSGVALRGTNPEIKWHGVRGEKGFFTLDSINQSSKRVLFCESPIDAMSLRALGHECQIVSTNGTATVRMQAFSKQLKEKGFEVVAAFDRDHAGQKMAQDLNADKKITPEKKDWNEDLCAGRTLEVIAREFSIKSQTRREERESPSRYEGFSR